ncbi:MAG: hypothetical protein AB1665_01975 [Candidatus Thermoplasmatota archaeon]
MPTALHGRHVFIQHPQSQAGSCSALDGTGFIRTVQERLYPISPVAKNIIERQLTEMGISQEFMTPKQAEMLIRRVSEALSLFIGPGGAEHARQLMLRELRRCAPDYFMSIGL